MSSSSTREETIVRTLRVSAWAKNRRSKLWKDLVAIMKASALLSTHRHTSSNRLKYQTNHTSMKRALIHSQRVLHECTESIKRSFEQEKSMFKPYLSLDVLKSQRSHVPHLWGTSNMGCKPKCGNHSLSSIACSFFLLLRLRLCASFPFLPIQIFLCLFLAVLFSTVLQIRCRFFYCSRCLLT